jgi:hypothetical protein
MKSQQENTMDSLCIIGISADRGGPLTGRQVSFTVRMITASSWETAKEKGLCIAKEEVFKESEGWGNHQATVHDLCWMMTDWKDETDCPDAAKILEEVANHAAKLVTSSGSD